MVVVMNSDVVVPPSSDSNALKVLQMMKSKKVGSIIVNSNTVGLDTVTKLSELECKSDEEVVEEKEEEKEKEEETNSTSLGPCLPEKEQDDLSEDEDEVDRKATEGVEMDILRGFDRKGNRMVTHVATATRRRVRYKEI